MHIHKYKLIISHPAVITLGSILKSINGTKIDVIADVYECTKCDKKKGYIVYPDGRKEKMDPRFIQYG